MYLNNSMPVLSQFYWFDLLSGDLDLGPRSQLHFLSKAQMIDITRQKSSENVFFSTMETIPYSYIGSVIRTTTPYPESAGLSLP